MSLLPQLEVVGDGIYAPNLDVAKSVREFLDTLSADFVDHTRLWPIHGIASDATIRLDEWTEFRELRVEEKLHCLNLQIISPSLSQLKPENSRWFALYRRTRNRKSFGGNQEATDFTSRNADIEQALEDFLVIVPIVNDRVAYHADALHAAPHFEVGGIFEKYAVGRSCRATNDLRFLLMDEDAKLDAQRSGTLCYLWQLIRSTNKKNFEKRVANAARRLFYAETRTKPEDALVDLMIAAESLYLDSDKNELRYRMSLNAALWSDVKASEKRAVMNKFKKAYDLRSKVVHGSGASTQSLADVISVIKPVLRVGVSKALLHPQLANAPDWESMIFRACSEAKSAE